VGGLPDEPAAFAAIVYAELGDGHISGALDEIPKPVVVAPLRSPHGRPGNDHRPFAHALNSSRTVRAVRRRETVRHSDDNSRRKVQNVRRASSAIYLLSGNTTPAESRSALKPLTESKTCRMSNWTRILTCGLDVRKSRPTPPWSAKSLTSQTPQ
jgi:hypothetical protein